MRSRTNCERIVSDGIDAAKKATTCRGEFDAWIAVLAQHMPLPDERWVRVPRFALRLRRRVA